MSNVGPLGMRILIALFVLFVATTSAHAGAWGEGSFDNDDALDWVAECTKSNSITPVAQALRAVIDAKYIEAPLGSAAVAAAEVVAATVGKSSVKLPPNVQSWVARQPSEEIAQLAPLAKQALARIQDPRASELWQLWAEGKPNTWRAGIAALVARLEK